MIEVKLIDKMGTDLSVVNAARVSFDKISDWEYNEKGNGDTEFKDIAGLKEGDQKLIKYLATHGHWTPFGHASVSVHVKAPIFVARQLAKHQVGLVWNEISRRYVDSDPEFYKPDSWREKHENKKQGSHEDKFVTMLPNGISVNQGMDAAGAICFNLYKQMLKGGVCPEQARMVLPQSMYTEWYWSGSLIAFARICNLRCKADAQLETRLVGDQIDTIVRELFPVSWPALRK